jgi:transglutaminase-like putative cysteine protease
VTDEVAYRSDPRGGPDYVKSPQQTLDAAAGDCEDKSILLISLLETLGHHTYMVFGYKHAYALDCFDRPLLELVASEVFRRGKGAPARQYLADIAPHHDPDALMKALKTAVELKVGGRHCYALEGTAEGSWIGIDQGKPRYLRVFDAVEKREVAFTR